MAAFMEVLDTSIAQLWRLPHIAGSLGAKQQREGTWVLDLRIWFRTRLCWLRSGWMWKRRWAASDTS